MDKTYICIDLKSFYASVECVERGLDPFTTNLVVADPDRTEKTICLAITPAMKALGIKNRCRVFEIPKGIDYIMAVPRMGLYIEYSADIYSIYLKYISREDIHVYSIDEVFMDVTDYLSMYGMSAKQLGIMIMKDIEDSTGITATCGIGSNMYLAKIALDITAKHVADHIGILDEESYRKTLWDHKPLRDFWRVGPGIEKRLARCGITTMRQIAQADENLLYSLFGVDAELLIDHAYGRETTTIADGRQLLAAFALGAVGVQLGTCLLASTECPIHPAYKEAVLKAKDNDTVVTGRITGTPVRIIKNSMAREYVKQEKAGADKMELEKFTLGSLRRAVFEGDVKTGSLMAGQVVGQIDEIKPVAEIFKSMYEGYDKLRKQLADAE